MVKKRQTDMVASATSGGRRKLLSFTNEFWAWLERQPNSKKNFLLAVLTACALGLPSAVKSIWDYVMAPLPCVTLPCQTAAFPLRTGQGDKTVYGFELSPSWGSQLQMSVARSVPDGRLSLWPTDTEVLDPKTGAVRSGGGFLCFLTNHSERPLTSIRLALRVTYRKPGAPSREPIQLTLPDPIEAFQSFAFYLADDTGWDPEVVLPDQISAKIGDSQRVVEIPVQYSTPPPPQPMGLRAFEPIRIRVISQ